MPVTQEPLCIQYSMPLMTYLPLITKCRAGLQFGIGFGLQSMTKYFKIALQSTIRLQSANVTLRILRNARSSLSEEPMSVLFHLAILSNCSNFALLQSGLLWLSCEVCKLHCPELKWN